MTSTAEVPGPGQTGIDHREVPFARPAVGREEIDLVVETLESGWLTTGPRAAAFEAAFAERLGVRHALAVSSGTAGLHLALEACGVGPGDRVLTTVYTFTATAEVARYLDADPLFVDIDPTTLNLDLAQVEAALEAHRDIRAIVPVDIAGLACDQGALEALARRHDVALVDDAAHAFPARSNGRLVGTFGDATAFSFYATKTLVTGEGGMVVTDDDALAQRMRIMRLHGIDRDAFDRYRGSTGDWYYEVVAPGFKYNMPDLLAALGLPQLARADALRAARQAIAERYDAAFADLPLTPPPRDAMEDHAWHLYILRLDAALDRDRFALGLRAHGVGSSVHFIPLHRQPYWRDRYGLDPGMFPAAEACFGGALSLPIWPDMSDADVDHVIAVVRALCRQSA